MKSWKIAVGLSVRVLRNSVVKSKEQLVVELRRSKREKKNKTDI